jgi:hypothetical protein
MGLLARLKSAFSGSHEGQPRGPFTLVGEFGTHFGVGPLEDGWQRNLRGSHDRNLVVAAIRNAYAYSLSSSGLDHVRTQEDGGLELLTSSAVYRVLRYPNAYQTQVDFVSMLVSCLIYHGNFYAYARRNDRNEIVELHPVPPGKQRAFVDETGALWYDVSGTFDRGPKDPQAYFPARELRWG